MCNHPVTAAEQMIQQFLVRRRGEVSLAEMRTHMGTETQRQWSKKAIERARHVLFGLFSVVTL